LRGDGRVLISGGRVRWCNGSTTPFGGVCFGSNPSRTANNSAQFEGFEVHRTVSAQLFDPVARKVTFPQHITHRKAEAVIYGKSEKYPFYRVVHRDCTHKRVIRSFKTYAKAKAAADKAVRDLASGSAAASLTAQQSRDAIAAIERLAAFRQATGKTVSLLAAVSEYCEAAMKVSGTTLAGAVEGYQNTLASLKPMDLSAAVEEFITDREAKTRRNGDKRAQLSKNYAYITAMWLRGFAGEHKNTMVSDLTKGHLDIYMAGKKRKNLAPKSRNHIRATLRMFLGWAQRKDYLSPNHRLLEAEGMRREQADGAETDFYRPDELRKLLDAADETMRPIIALCALAGLRQQEALRLTWEDVFRVSGHVEVTSAKSKTRSRRLVTMVPALAAWLKPYRRHKGFLWEQSEDTYQEAFAALRESLGITARRNGLRHGFCTYHFAAKANENLTAQQAGNSPAMIHAHYKGLATSAEARKWFGIRPVGLLANVVNMPKQGKA
jgi:integrase